MHDFLFFNYIKPSKILMNFSYKIMKPKSKTDKQLSSATTKSERLQIEPIIATRVPINAV